MTNMSIDE